MTTLDHAIDRSRFDAITAEQLRAAGGLKWSLFPGTIGAFVAEMDFGTAPVITAALRDAVERNQFGYLPSALSEEMSSACALWQRETYGWDVSPEQVHLLPDVIKGLEVCIEHYSRPGSPVIVPVPAYMPFLQLPAHLGREIITVPLQVLDGVYRMDLDALDAAYGHGGHLLVLCNPYNPVGRVFDREELTAIASVVDRHGGRVFADEIHSPLVFAGSAHLPYASLSTVTAGHTITATSASKAWNIPGLKCAQLIISNDADAEIWAERVGVWASHGAANLGVIANTVAYTDGRPWLEEVIGYLDRNRVRLGELVTELLPGVGYSAPEGTYIGWLDCRSLDLGTDDAQLARNPADFFREQAGVALTDGGACGTPGFVRIVFATPTPVLEQAITQMGAALHRRPPSAR